MLHDPRISRPLMLLKLAAKPPPGVTRICAALLLGGFCHIVFAAGVLAMITAMFHGMSLSFGSVPWPWAAIANGLLIVQFPIIHSWLLTGSGGRLMVRLLPGVYGTTLSTTTYAIIASLQLLLLFALWTPSGVVWWKAEGTLFWMFCAAYGCSWLLLAKASFDAGVEVQSGALGWMSLLANIRPVFPDMPTLGLFRFIRHPIYAAFVLTLWTVPTWSPDQLVIALSFTSYCLAAPFLKERRFALRYGDRFHEYRAEVPYMLPRSRHKDSN